MAFCTEATCMRALNTSTKTPCVGNRPFSLAYARMRISVSVWQKW